MYRALTRIVSTATAVCLAVLCCGCSNLPSTADALKAQAAASSLSAAATLEQGVLTIGINADDAPYSWRSIGAAEGSVPVEGIDVDVALSMASGMGLKARLVNVGANYSAAAQGICDVVMGGTPATVYDGSEVIVGAYSQSAPAVFAKGSTALPAVSDLAVASIGVQENSASARALQAMAPTAALMGFATLNDAFAALESGTVAYVACDSFMGGYLATAYPDISLVGALSLPETRGVAVSAANAELQQAVRSALDVMAANGELRSIRSSWVGDLAAISESNQVLPTPVQG